MATKNLGISITKTILLVSLVTIILLSSGFLASAASNKNASSKTRMDIYSDSACKHKITSIDWGSFVVGQQVNKTVYVKTQEPRL